MVAYFTSSIIIDDIVMPDGRTALGMLGGGGPQSAFGMRLWTQLPIGLCGGVGPDFPPAAQAWLAALEIDTTGVRVDPVAPTPRAWQVMEWDGRRTQVWRTPNAATSHHLALRPDLVPPSYWRARGFHGGVHPEHPNHVLLQALRGAGICVCLEPFRAATQPLADTAVRELVTHCDLFSPNLSEAASLVGPGDPDMLATRLLDAGAPRVALRMGQEGSLLRCATADNRFWIPAVEVNVVDPVGAGNAYCGALLVGWLETQSLLIAGQYASVAASFLVEQVGLPAWRPGLPAEARARLQVGL